VSAASCAGRFPGVAKVFAGFESTSVIISPLLIDPLWELVKFNRPFKFAAAVPAVIPYCKTVAFGIELLPFEFPARHDSHSFPLTLLHRCENTCGDINPASVVIGDNGVTTLLSSRNVGDAAKFCESPALSVTIPPGSQNIPG
jgi:hypothetical protein